MKTITTPADIRMPTMPAMRTYITDAELSEAPRQLRPHQDELTAELPAGIDDVETE